MGKNKAGSTDQDREKIGIRFFGCAVGTPANSKPKNLDELLLEPLKFLESSI